MSERVWIGNISHTLTDGEKEDIAKKVKEMFESENWTFTLEDGSTVKKVVFLDD